MQFKILPDILRLYRDLPSCPAGTKFIKSLDGQLYYNVINESNPVKQYFFSIEHIKDNYVEFGEDLSKGFFVNKEYYSPWGGDI